MMSYEVIYLLKPKRIVNFTAFNFQRIQSWVICALSIKKNKFQK